MSIVDNIETSRVRPGEELNETALAVLIRSRFGDLGELQVSQFPAGSSNLTYLVKFEDAEYVLRRPPFGNTVRTAHDMRREFEVLSKLSETYGPAPKPLIFCDDPGVIGSEFYLMERRHGIIIRGRAPRELAVSREMQAKVCQNFIQNLASLHKIDYKAAGLGDLGRPDGYNRRQVEGWSKRYFAAKSDELPELERTITWLNDNIVSESGAALIHNDYKFDNIVLDPSDLSRITAVLDWEMVTVGDPLMDLGTTLGYWMSADAGEEMLNMPFNPRVLMENFARTDLVEIYANASGRDVSNVLFYYVFGTFKIAVIAQQIYARYLKGFTKDERFSGFGRFADKLGQISYRALQTMTI